MSIYSKIRRGVTSAGLLCAAMGAPALASTYFDLTPPGGFVAGNDGFGNFLEFTASDSVTRARVTGWSALETSPGVWDIRRSTVRDYADGIGVIAPNGPGFQGDLSGSSIIGNQHVIDNINTIDFAVFQFSTDLAPQSVRLWPFITVPAPGQRGRDADALFAYGDTPAPWNSYVDFGSSAALLAYFGGDSEPIDNADQPDGRTFLPLIDTLHPGSNGSLFFVGASPVNADGHYDGFKVAYLTFTSAVPEPNAWAMLIAGFGFVGTGLRWGRRTAATA